MSRLNTKDVRLHSKEGWVRDIFSNLKMQWGWCGKKGSIQLTEEEPAEDAKAHCFTRAMVKAILCVFTS